jgi:hypothetical protein
MRTGFLACLACAALAAADDATIIYDDAHQSGWLTNGELKPIPKANLQADGLNPHGSGAYVVVHEKKYKDFVLDLDYKLTKGCNSGVFIRIGKPGDPVMTGIEIALDDTTGKGMHDPGAFYDLVAPSENAQKPAGEWNHMTVTARGPKIDVVLNGKEVSSINLDEWSQPGKRPDGSSHKFSGVAIRDLNQSGYLGFQDHGQDCWFKNVKVKSLD